MVTNTFVDTGTTQYTNFQTGKLVPDYTPTNSTAALGNYPEQLAKYPYVESGFDLQYPVPDDLLLPFRDFVPRYGLEDLLGLLFDGLGDILKQLIARKILVQPCFKIGIETTNFLSYIYSKTSVLVSLKIFRPGFSAKHDNSLLYENASADLGQDVLLCSTILAVNRSGSDGENFIIKTPSSIILIKSHKLVSTIPPK